MALSGIPVGSSTRLTTPKPHLRNSSFPGGAAERLAAGQVRHTAWDYHDEDTGLYWRIKRRSQCFTANAQGQLVIAATQAGTWGTLDSHWTEQGAGVAPPAGGGIEVALLPEYTLSTDGAQSLALPTGASSVFDLNVLEPSGYVRPLYPSRYAVSGTTLSITTVANLRTGDKVRGYYATQSAMPTAPTRPAPQMVNIDGTTIIADETVFNASGQQLVSAQDAVLTAAFSQGSGTVQISTDSGANWQSVTAGGLPVAANTSFSVRVLHPANTAFYATLTLTY